MGRYFTALLASTICGKKGLYGPKSGRPCRSGFSKALLSVCRVTQHVSEGAEAEGDAECASEGVEEVEGGAKTRGRAGEGRRLGNENQYSIVEVSFRSDGRPGPLHQSACGPSTCT
eukprot:TRINITY_DN5097_c0_g1_i1.p3 TRINITY_DN5097_c0_g1~~TRINITY_DN5097_c0_g1_i1.p3  ORF type:complete len:116 (-),score=6.86 TRINITY_DN5097_c0_g1_i1:341-688(-)